MKIRFGLMLDGQHGWHSKNALGETTVGTNGMLVILETQLGLIAEAVPQSRRVVQYLECLRRSNNPGRFFHKSLITDELGTAASLLTWRDKWYLSGWDGNFANSAAARLADMHDVEQLARTAVAPCAGERLASILEVMGRRRPAIEKVTLVHPLSSFPKRWRQVLANLPIEECAVEPILGDGTVLSDLQARLRQVQAGEEFGEKDALQYRPDGSIEVVRAETRILASRWLAERLGQGVGDAVLVASDSAALLDDVLSASGQARHGLSESSAYRPALQLLPMALALLWAPLDFSVLISFLSHPVSPVRSFARRRLAGKLADQPGIGGEGWERVLASIDEYYGEAAPAVREQISTWIDHPRFDQNEGVPVEEVMSRTKKLAEYFRVRLLDKDEASRISWNAAYAQTMTFARALEQLAQGETSRILPRQLQKLLAQATARGSANPKLVAEVGSLPVVDNPAAVIETFDHVIWWQPVLPAMPRPYPWSTSECAELAKAGAELPDVSALLEDLAAEWQRPILTARKKLTIVLPPKDAEVHPMWQMIEAMVSGIPEAPLEAVFGGGTAGPVEVPYTPLPRPKRWWNLPPGTPIPKRHGDSFSSLEPFIFNPYQWLLRYPAALRSSNILSPSDGFLLCGQLAHRVVERFFDVPEALGMQDHEIAAWFEKDFARVVETEGAVLLMHGRHSDYEDLRYRLRRALLTLVSQLRAAHVAQVQTEVELAGGHAGGEIFGYADLVLTNEKGTTAILDMKWGGSKKYSAKLAENRHLQLGIYAELLRQKAGAWPEVGYYILSEARLFVQQDNYFPDGGTVSKAIDESTPHLWERFKASYQWRADLLQQGRVEVVLPHIGETEESETPSEGLPAEELPTAYNEYLNLAGWEAV